MGDISANLVICIAVITALNATLQFKVASPRAPPTLPRIDKYVFLGRSYTISCNFSSYNNRPGSGLRCHWWRNGTLLLTYNHAYSISMDQNTSQCTLTFNSVNKWQDAAPSDYRCGPGERLTNALPITIRLWTRVQPPKIQITVSGQTLQTIDLSEWSADNPPIVKCSVSGGRPVAQLYFQLGVLRLNSSAVHVSEMDGHWFYTIHLNDSYLLPARGQVLTCRAQDPSYTEYVYERIYVVGKYKPASSTVNTTPATQRSTDKTTTAELTVHKSLIPNQTINHHITTARHIQSSTSLPDESNMVADKHISTQITDGNVVLLGAVGGAAALLLIIFIMLLLITMRKRRGRGHTIPAVVQEPAETVVPSDTTNMSQPVTSMHQQGSAHTGCQTTLTCTSNLASSQMALTDSVYYEHNDIYEMSSLSTTPTHP